MPKRSERICMLNQEKLKKINPETLKLYHKYLLDMKIRELSEKTIYNYYNDLANWWIYIYDYQDNKSVKEIDDSDISEFIVYCKDQGNNTNRIKRRMSSISAFFLFLKKKRLIDENPMSFIDRPKEGQAVVAQTFLTTQQIQFMREKLQENVEKAKEQRKAKPTQYYEALTMQAYAIFSLTTMARINAIANIRWEQLDFDSRVAKDVLEKEGYLVELFFSEEAKEYLLNLKQYRTENNIEDGGYVFVSAHRKSGSCTPATVSTLSDYCKKIGQMIGVPTLHPHDFRHSGATAYKNAGMSLEEVSVLLNHKSTDVTRRFYIKEDKSKLQANKDKCNI